MPYGQLPGVNTPVANPLMQLLQASAPQQGPQLPAGLAQLLGLSQGQSLTDRLKAMGEPAQQQGPNLANMLNPAAVDNLFKQNQPPVSQTPIQDMLDNILPDLDVPEQTDPNQDMLEMLLSGAAIPSAGGGSADYEQMMQAATKGVAQPFNAQIGLLKHQNKAAKAETAAIYLAKSLGVPDGGFPTSKFSSAERSFWLSTGISNSASVNGEQSEKEQQLRLGV